MQAGSERQVKAVTEAIVEKVHEANEDIKSVEGKDGANWILLDLGDVIVHVFKEETRQFYNLEKLWSDAPLVDIEEWSKTKMIYSSFAKLYDELMEPTMYDQMVRFC